MFEEKLFEGALVEFDNPDLLEYEFFTFVESTNTKIYRKYNQNSGLYEYKVIGSIECPADICQKVYMDLEYRKKWDSYVAELEEIKCDNGNFIYWNVNYPFPLSNRDYTYIKECREFDVKGEKTWVILAKSHYTETIKQKRKVIRVDDFHQFMVIQPDGDTKTRAYMHYYDDPKGMLPTWLINWGAKTGVPSFLKSMKTACDSYNDYLAKKNK